MTRGLVPIPTIDPGKASPGGNGRANADFLAHLIATSAQMPQTRARRRAEPGVAISAYDALGQWPMPSGTVLSRSL